jgi:hypothetical protein
VDWEAFVVIVGLAGIAAGLLAHGMDDRNG